jgi:hypothetical protein
MGVRARPNLRECPDMERSCPVATRRGEAPKVARVVGVGVVVQRLLWAPRV